MINMIKVLKAYLDGKFRGRASAFALGLFAVSYALTAVAVVTVDTVPLTVANTVPSNLVLVPSVEWPTVVTHANDPGQGDGASTYTGYVTAPVTSCSSGYTLSGSNCTLTVSATASCASGYTLSGSSCTQSVAANSNCPSGYTLNGTTCQQAVAANAATCPSGYTANGTTCQQIVAANAATCPSGYTANGTTCQKTLGAANAATCPSGYTASGTTCQKSVAANAATCPSGYSANGTTCQQTVAANAATCPSGYSPSGTTCQQTVAANAATCPSGYSPNGTTCQKTVAATPNYSCPNNYTLSAPNCTRSGRSSCPSSPQSGYSGYSILSGSSPNYTCSGPANITSYSCSSGTLSGSNCIVTTTPSTYSCSSGTLSGSNCIVTTTPSTYSCSSGTLSGSNCIVTTTPSTYSCSSGTLSGSNCISTTTPLTYSCSSGTVSGSSCIATTTPSTYSCSSGTLSGSNCISTTTPSTYSCSSGTLSGSNCIISTSLVYSCTSGTLSGTGSGSICTTTATPTYSCASGTVSGSNCTITTAATTQSVPYAGYFNSSLCYAYQYDDVEANRYFYPVSNTTSDNSTYAFSCAGQTDPATSQKLWSGNFLNWASMQAIDTFRLTLTGGYRVNRPADGTPPSVTITGSDGNSATKTTGDQPGVTYLEKATTDRWTSTYTYTRSLSSSASNAVPFTGTVSSSNLFLTRVAGLRDQMWFIPYSASSGLGSAGSCCSATNAIDLPVSSTTQSESTRQPSGATRNTQTAIPYNPTYDTLPNVTTASNTNSTPCGTSPIEYGCSAASWTCPYGGTATSGTCSAQSNVTACTGSTYPYYRSASCHSATGSTGDTTSTSNLALACTSPSATISNSTPSTKNSATCSLSAYAGTPATYAHPGRDLIYTVSIRVKVCDGTWDTRSLCTQYGNNYKPEGLLQKNATKTRYSLFSYLTENDSNKARVGGVMRARQKLIGPVVTGEQPYPDRTGRISGIDNPEWDPTTGVFINDPDTTDSTYTTNKIGGCTSSATPDGSSCVIQYSGVINYINRFGELGTGLGSTSTTYTSDPLATLKEYDNLSEMYYSALSYIRGLGNNAVASNLQSTSGYTNSAMFYYQNADGFPVIEDWYKNGANVAVTKWNSTTPALTVGQAGDPMLYSCQTTAVLGIGDSNTNSEQSQNSSDSSSTTGGSNGPFPAATLTSWLAALDSGASSRGGPMYIAGLAYWAHLNDLRTDVPNTAVASGYRGQTVSTYMVDVVEKGDYKTSSTNQYYNATKYGGFTLPSSVWDANGNATLWGLSGSIPTTSSSWLGSNQAAWTSQTSTTPGGYYQPSNMYFANNGANMISGLTAAFSKIQLDAAGSGSSLAANSTQLTTGTTTYQARYYSGVWTGDLTAYALSSTGGINAASLWSAAAQLPTTVAKAASRIIKTTTDGTASGSVNFDTTLASNSALRTQLGSTATAQNNVINYLRGDPSNTAFRSRSTALGDIVDSQPVFVGASDPNIFYSQTFTGTASYATFASGTTSRAKRIWIAANDGMVHGFNAECAINSSSNGCAATTPAAGAETFAYIPKAVLTNTTTPIQNLSNPLYGASSTLPHQYFNDGELTVADVYSTSSSSWRTVLVGTTGRGAAKAVYALDVTDPTTTPTLLWERSAGDGKTGSNYIGQMIGKPIIAQTSDGVWSVLIGNGYNSSKDSAALLQFAITDGTLTVHTTDDTVTSNGLAPPAVWLANPANGLSTEAYAGDLAGNVWHFDLTSTAAGNVVFVAKDASTTPKAQPITGGMLIGKDPATGYVWLFFGTGRYLTQTDLRNTDTQTWYGIIVEGSTYSVTSSTTRSSLGQRTIVAQIAASGTSAAARAISTPTSGDLATKSGWYLDLVYGTAQGERMVTPNQFQGSLLLGTTRIPTSSDPCNPSGSGWVMAISPFTGAPPGSSFFDVNGSGTVDANDKFTVNGVTYVAAGIGFAHAPNNPIFVGNSMLLSFDDASTKSYVTAGTIGVIKRLAWREILSQ